MLAILRNEVQDVHVESCLREQYSGILDTNSASEILLRDTYTLSLTREKLELDMLLIRSDTLLPESPLVLSIVVLQEGSSENPGQCN